jgi:hypothetical protein
MLKTKTYLIAALLGLASVGASAADDEGNRIFQADNTIYNDNTSRLVFQTEDRSSSLGVKLLLQEHLAFTKAKGENLDFGVGIPRARVKLFGQALNPKLTYFLQAKLEAVKAEKLEVLEDFFINYAVYPRHFHIRAGKFGTPFSRNYLVPRAQMRFPTDNLAGHKFKLKSDVGVMAHSGLSHPIEWALAVVDNGVVGRIGYNHSGIDGFELVDFAGGDFRYAAALSGFAGTDWKTQAFGDMRGAADFIAKYRHVAGHSEFYVGKWDKVTRYGLNADVGYLINRHWEPALHYSWYRDAASQHEAALGVNYYFYGHHLQLQGYAGADFGADAIKQYKAGAQLQFAI